MKLNSLLDPVLLANMLEQGYVNVRYHPDDPDYRIYNYSDKAAYERVWNPVTRLCRGLVVRQETVLARPFEKFFNLHEPESDYVGMNEYVRVDEKVDGSLGIVYTAPDDKPAIATRGSFTSEQAIWATNYLRTHAPDWRGVSGVTYLCEIVYPANRIVLDYKGLEDLVLLDVLDNLTGLPVPPSVDAAWDFSAVAHHGHETLLEALERPPRPNAEGYVLSTADGRKLKIKQQDYLELHRVVTNLTPKRVWQYMAEHGSYVGLAASVPDEFAQMIEQWGNALLQQAAEVRRQVLGEWEEVKNICKIGEDRKYWAETIKDVMQSPKMGFLLLDGRDIEPVIWRDIEPKGA